MDPATFNCEKDALKVKLESDKNGNSDTDMDTVDSKSKEKLSIDRGWAWVVLIACSLQMFIMFSWGKCTGIFFVELQRRFKSSSSATSVLFSLQNAFFSITAFGVMTVGKSMSSRTSVTIGATMVSACFLLTAFAPSLSVVYFTGGVLSGAFFAFMQPHIMTMLNTYFDKYRGLANNIAAAFVSVGALAMAPLYTKLFEHYGFTGTFILLAGIMLNIVVTAMLLRPVGIYKKSIPSVQELVKGNSGHTVLLKNGEQNVNDVQNDNGKQSTHGSTVSLASVGIQQAGVIHLRSSNTQISVVSEDNVNTSNAKRTVNTLSQAFAQVNGLLQNRVFLYYILCNVFLSSGCIVAEAYIGPYAADMGMGNESVAMLISSIAIADLCSKVFVGYLSDRKWIQRSTIMAIAATTLGIVSFFVYFMSSFWSLLVFAILIGILQPVYFALFAVVAIDILSLEQLKSVLGFLSLVQGSAVASGLPVAGYLRDCTGSYHATFWFCGSLLVVGGVLCFFLPNVKAKSDSKTRGKRSFAFSCESR